MQQQINSSSNELDGFLTGEQLEQKLGISRRTRIRWNALRIGPPPVKVGRVTLYRIASVNEWMALNERKPVQSATSKRTRKNSVA